MTKPPCPEKARATPPCASRRPRRALWRRSRDALIIGCDQVAELDGARLGKPGNHAQRGRPAHGDARQGRGVPYRRGAAQCRDAARCRWRTCRPPSASADYDDGEIERYLELEQPYDCAGSAKIEGLGIVLVERVTGDDPTALIGLPLMRLAAMLRNEGVAVV